MSASIFALIGCLAASPPPGLLAQHDLVWEVPPPRWLAGMPLANGDIGAMLWGDGAPLRVTLDKYDAWETREQPLDLTYDELRAMVAEGRRDEAEAAMRTEHIYRKGGRGPAGLAAPATDLPYPTRLPMPRVEVDLGGFAWGTGTLRLGDATAALAGTWDETPAEIDVFVHAEQNAVILTRRGGPEGPLPLHVGLDHLDEGARDTLRAWGYPAPTVEGNAERGSLVLEAPSGYVYAVAWEQVATDRGGTLALALMSSNDAPNPLAEARAIAAEAASAGGHHDTHAAWWARYWDRSWLTIPDARLEALYYAEMYKLACSSRPGELPITLQGLWTLDGGMPPWSGDYHLDMNVQQSYWPIYTANRLDLGEPLYRAFSACLPRWRQQCQDFFGFDGIWAGCAIGPHGERVFGYSGVELWPGNAAWLAHHYWLHFLHSQDKSFLREEAVPFMALAFLTYANLLEAGDDGHLHVPMSYSPEYHEGSMEGYARDPACDLALIRFLGDALLEANAVLEAEHELTPRIREVLEKLAPYPTRNGRLMVSAEQGFDRSHRHHSHLMAIHPLGLLNRDGTPEEQALIHNSLHEIRVHGTGLWTGWAYPWMSLIASRAGYGNMAWTMLDVYANAFIMPNTLHINGDPRIHGLSRFDYEPMTLEAGFGAAAAVMEMLLQSHGRTIQVFPTMPGRWHDAYFAGLRAEGAFLVTAKCADGRAVFVEITAEAGGPCRVKNPFAGPVHVESGTESRTFEGDWIEFNTDPGKTYLLYPAGARPDATAMAPPEFHRTERETHVYGVKHLPRF